MRSGKLKDRQTAYGSLNRVHVDLYACTSIIVQLTAWFLNVNLFVNNLHHDNLTNEVEGSDFIQIRQVC